MTLFKYFLVLLLRSYKVILSYILIFIAIGFLTMTSSQPIESGYEEKRVVFGLVDEDGSEASRNLASYLEERNIRRKVEGGRDLEEAVFLGYYDVVILIPEGYSENPAQNKIELIKNSLLPGYYKIKQDIIGYNIMMGGSTDENGRVNYSLLKSALEQDVKVEFRRDDRGDVGLDQWFSRFMNSTSYVAIAIIVFVIGTVMADFNNRKIALRNACAGKTLSLFQSQLILGQILFGFILSILILIPAILMAGEEALNPKLGLYWLNLMALILSILSFTFMIHHVMSNKHALSAIANIFSLGSSFLCGVFIPLEFLSETTRTIGQFFPSYYFVRANEAIYLGTELWQINIGVELLFSAAFLMMGYYIAKRKMSRKELGI